MGQGRPGWEAASLGGPVAAMWAVGAVSFATMHLCEDVFIYVLTCMDVRGQFWMSVIPQEPPIFIWDRVSY